MSFDPQQADVDRQVDASMRMFERAKVGPAAALSPTEIARVLICPDGSTQDQAIEDAVGFLKSRFPAANFFRVDAREGAVAEPPAALTASLAGIELCEVEGEDAYDKILAAATACQADLLVLPCPFGRDFESVGADSAGTVIDVLLSRCLVPLLIMRGPHQPMVQATQEMVLVVGSENESEPAAAALAFALASSGAKLTLNLVIGKEQVENVRQLLSVIAPDKEVDRESLAGALASAHAKLDLALHKTALAMGIDYQMDPQQDVTYPDSPDHPLLVIVPLEQDDQFGHGFVQNRIRNSPHPLLIVPR